MPTFKSMPKAGRNTKTNANTNANTKKEPKVLHQPPVKHSKIKRLMMWLLLVILVMIASAGAVIYLTWPAGANLISFKATGEEQMVARPAATPAPKATEAPIFLTLEPFTTNISDGTQSRIFHVVLTPQLSDKAALALLEKHKPIVRDRILRLLSEQNPVYIQTPEGRQQLVDSLTLALNQPYEGGNTTARPPIQSVLFTTFVIQ